MRVGNKVKTAMAMQGKSMNDLAKDTGMSVKQVKRICNDTGSYSLGKLEQVLGALNMELQVTFKG